MADVSGHGWPLVGREDELVLLDERVGQGGDCVVLAGPMGVGKSRLMTTWASAFEAGGGTAVVVRATRSTATIPFGAFAGWVPPRLGGADDRLAVLQATAARLTGTAPGAPVVVAVDDAHLLDEGSAALVLHLVEHTSLGVVLTVRQGEPCPDAVVALWKEGLARRVDLGPLSEIEAALLLEQVLGGPVASAAGRRVWQLTDGNPLYLREVVEAARAQGVLVRTRGPRGPRGARGARGTRGARRARGAGGARHRRSSGRPEGSAGEWWWQGRLTGRTRLVELVSDRIGTSHSAERRVLELVALGEPLPVEVLARLAPRRLLAKLESRGLVVVEGSARNGDRVVRLAHPLYSEVLAAELPAFTAREHSAALADAAMAVGMDRCDPVRVATWLLDGGDQPARPDLLLRASLRGRVVDEYELSLRFAEAAERAGGGWRATLRRAIALGPLGRLDEADRLLSSLSAPGNDPAAHVAAAEVRAEQAFWYRGDDLPVALAVVEEAAEAVPAPVRSPLLSYGAQLAVAELELQEAIRLTTRAYGDAGSVADRIRAVTIAGLAAVFLGRTQAAMAAVRLTRPGAVELLGDDPVPALHVAHIYSLGAPLDGRIDEAAVVFRQMVDERFGVDSGGSQALITYLAGRAALDQGRVGAALDLCREALELQGEENPYGRGTWIATALALAAAQSGDAETAARAVDWIEAHTPTRVAADDRQTDVARAWLCAARGELSAARDTALAAAHRSAAAGAWMLEMTALLAAARLGAPSAAAPRLEELTQVVEGPYVVAAARFARAAARCDGVGLDDAAERFAALGARLHAAEAAVLASEAHDADGQRRRQGASRSRAQELAELCEGAVTPVLARLDQAPLVTTLTAREREVAELAARGRTSREIARTLGVSVRTIHSHLNHAYTKLGTSDRAALATALCLDGQC